jgi:hypothetical protein
MNIKHNQIVQVFENGAWRDYSKPCTLKSAVWLLLDRQKHYGPENIRIVTI